ncbi:MAG: hypothetical protein PHD43_19505 [Methylococcales bacterium]|nr:hypothetical protein [Methylococcales bacterium]
MHQSRTMRFPAFSSPYALNAALHDEINDVKLHKVAGKYSVNDSNPNLVYDALAYTLYGPERSIT